MLLGLAEVAGTALRGVFSLLRRIRHPRPIHPRGLVLTGQATWIRNAAPSGIGWIDDVRGEPLGVTAAQDPYLGHGRRVGERRGIVAHRTLIPRQGLDLSFD